MGLVEIDRISNEDCVDISKYAAFFHDGSLMDIQHIGNNIVFSMGSAEMDEEDLKDDILLSKDDRIAGKLHVERVKSIIIDENPFLGILKKRCDNGNIFHFEIIKNNLEMMIIWENFWPNPKVDEFVVIKIEAEKIWWENIPNLEELLES